jgi:hypothetical protein
LSRKSVSADACKASEAKSTVRIRALKIRLVDLMSSYSDTGVRDVVFIRILLASRGMG